jgi:hypothetical protein
MNPVMPGSKHEQAATWEARGDHQSARQLYAAAAREGDNGALHALARSLLLNDPPMPGAAVNMLKQAAERGEADASHLCAVIAAQDSQLPDNWRVALDYLQLSAEQGSENAGTQLKLLARAGDTLVVAHDTWRAIRQRIDIQRWLTPPSRRVIFEKPRVVR